MPASMDPAETALALPPATGLPTMPFLRDRVVPMLALLLGSALSITVRAQTPMQPDFAGRWLAPDEPLRWRIDAEQQAQWRRWRIFLGSSDVSALLRLAAPGELLLAPVGTAWAPGEGELVVYDGDGWTELARWPVRVRTAGGFETSEATPRLDLQLDARGAEGSSDGDAVSPRGTHADTGVGAGWAWRGTRGGWAVEAAV
jgi:hypothetical protein